MIHFHSEEISFELDKNAVITEWLEGAIQSEKRRVGEINCIFCSDDYLLQMNQQYLQHDYYTDIITFDYCEGTLVSGDLFISVDRVKDNAELTQQTFENELHRVIIHGVLHLLGYSDKESEAALLMRQKEDHYLSLLNN